MYYSDIQIALQEVPGEVSICFSITGCNFRCKGCHTPILWKEGSGKLLTDDVYKDVLSKYTGMASCVLFMGGERHKDELLNNLKYAKTQGYNTCLYSGEEEIENELLSELTWAKTGSWKQELGGLGSQTTNQKFTEVKSNKILNHLFLKN